MLFNEFYFVKTLDKKIVQLKFGENLRKIRSAKGFTQEQLANELGIEISQISRIERGVINTSISTVYSLSLILNVNVSTFFEFDDLK